MHPLLDVDKRAGPCGPVIGLVEQCYAQNAKYRFMPVSPCDPLLVQLDRCLQSEKKKRQAANQAQHKEARKRLMEAKRLAAAADTETIAAQNTS